VRPRSLLCMPLLHQGRLAGIIYLENNAAQGVFTPDRVQLLTALSTQAAIAIENALLLESLQRANAAIRQANETLEQQVVQRTQQLQKALSELWAEMDLARKIQTILLPSEPRLRGYEIAAAMQPAKNVGGDYYDVLESGDAGWVLVGDVSNHGVSAGLCMMMVTSIVRAALLMSQENNIAQTPSSLLSHTNAAIYDSFQHIGRGHYMTISALRIDGGRVTFAGLHMDILVYRASTREVERIETNGVWLGWLQDIRQALTDESFELAPEDVVLLFSDGITESYVGEAMLGISGLAQLFGECAREIKNPQEIMKRLLAAVLRGECNDDLTLLVMRRQG
jgi:histidine kinase